jgi:NADH-quinone oxidoreductase subunit F
VIDLLGEDECIVAYVGEKSRYGKAENCGRCVPCREGSKQLTNLLREVYDGEYRPNGIRELLRVVRSTSLCGFGPDMTRPVETALDHFEAEFHAHADGRCPAGACTADLSREVVA